MQAFGPFFPLVPLRRMERIIINRPLSRIRAYVSHPSMSYALVCNFVPSSLTICYMALLHVCIIVSLVNALVRGTDMYFHEWIKRNPVAKWRKRNHVTHLKDLELEGFCSCC